MYTLHIKQTEPLSTIRWKTALFLNDAPGASGRGRELCRVCLYHAGEPIGTPLLIIDRNGGGFSVQAQDVSFFKVSLCR
ncbi:MAG: hypothetical protein LOD87_08815, partial [Planifilum fulgidum]